MEKINLNKIQDQEVVPGFHLKVVHSKNMTLTYWRIEAASSLPEHSHLNEQVTNIIEGEFELTVDGKREILKPNSVVVIPSNSVHSGRAITDCKIIDVFYPVRDDYR